MQINTMFHDVHFMTRSYNSPKPFVFVMKRGGLGVMIGRAIR